jgi:isoquinoline 1-oxidoreductase beta subunit
MNALGRRGFLRVVTIAGGGLALGFGLSGCDEDVPWPNRLPGAFQPNAFLQLRTDGQIVLAVHKAEMGQGVSTGLATLVAEELEIDPLALQLVFAEPHKDYGDPDMSVMVTGGSSSMKGSWLPLREAAASMRAMLVQAAAARFGVPVADCIAQDGVVRLRDGSKRAGYGELAEEAAKLPVPAGVALKPENEWRRIGKHAARVDARSKIDGSAQFALDVHLPGMLTAVMLRCPAFGGRLASFDRSEAVTVPGVHDVFECARGVAVVADGYWQARTAADKVKLVWDKGPHAGLDSAAIAAEQKRLLDQEEGRVVRETGARGAGVAARTVEAEYRVPYLAHATMEPMNAVAHVQGDHAEIWAGNQVPDVLQGLVARALGIPAANVRVHTTLLGGGFGRRAYLDFAVEAALVAQEAGAPVKLVWSREDDTRHDWYRPAACARARVELDAEGNILAWEHRVVAPSVMALMIGSLAPALMPQWVPVGIMKPVAALIRRDDATMYEGIAEVPYTAAYTRTEAIHYDPGVPIGTWRSVGHSQNAFFAESFVDEVASALGEDPVAFRLKRLPEGSRHARVLKLAAEQAGWGSAGAGRFQGVAVHESFGSVVAEVVELVVENGTPRIERVVCAVDCGIAINPDIVRAQVESAVVFALSAALHGEITIADGGVTQGNFDDYPVLRMNECPAIETHIVASDAPPSGIGEPPTPPLAPALANALFAATGQRARSLPLKLA